MWRKIITAGLLVAYLVLLGLVVFWPSPVDEPIDGLLNKVLYHLHHYGVPDFVDFSFTETMANIALFVPYGLLVAALLPARYRWFALFVGGGSSLLIEAIQAVYLPERFPSLRDVMANTLGTALGIILVYAWTSRRRTPSAARQAQGP